MRTDHTFVRPANDDDIEALLSQAQQAQEDIGATPAPVPPGAAGMEMADEVQPVAMPDLTPLGDRAQQGFELLQDVQLEVKIELGRCEMYVDEVLGLSEGAVVQLDKLAGDPVYILVNEKLVARGEVLVLNDNFCVRVGEILAPEGE